MHYTLVGVRPTKFGGHRAYLSILIPGWPCLAPAWPLTHQCMTLWSGVLSTKFGSHRAFLSNLITGWPRLTPAWPLTPAMHYTLVGALLIKFGGHRAYLTFWALVEPGWSLYGLWLQQCLKKSKLDQAPPNLQIWALCALSFPRRSPDKQTNPQTNRLYWCVLYRATFTLSSF